MSLRNLTKVPKFSLVYFAVDKSTCIAETKKLRTKGDKKPFLDTKPERKAAVIVKCEGKTLEAMVIATHDDVDQLNAEEKVFVEDPANAHLFDEAPSAEKKRAGEQSLASMAKKSKHSNDEVEELEKFLKEQSEKEARLKQQRLIKENPKISTREAAVQCDRRGTVDVAVQTDYRNDVTEDLREQVRKLTQIVADLTALKAREEMKEPTLPSLSDDNSLSVALSDVLPFDSPDTIAPEMTPPPGPVDPPSIVQYPVLQHVPVSSSQHLALPPRAPLSSQNNGTIRSPLATVDQNIQAAHRPGPTDEQRRKVEAIVFMGTQIITTAMACVEVLFTEAELANGNTSGSKGYQPLDDLKLRFLSTTLRQKFDSPVFTDQWDNIRERINTKCRGKRRTVLRRLYKQTNV